MKDIKAILTAFKYLTDRVKKLESIGIPKDGYTPIKGKDYFDGAPGKDGLPGRDGIDGKDGRDFTFDMFTPEQLCLLKGKQGEKGEAGKDGINGINGKDGKPGRNGNPGPRGEKGEKGDDGDKGEDGRGIDDAYIDKNGHLIIVFTDGEKKDVGKVKGEDGRTGYGITGARGPSGEGIKSVTIDEIGHLIVITTDGREIDAGQIPNTPYPHPPSGNGNVSSDSINRIWVGTQEEYDDLKEHFSDTIYFIKKSEASVYNTGVKYNSGIRYNAFK